MPTLTPDACDLLYHVAADVRAKQKQYFKTRQKPDLKSAKQAERTLDALLLKYTPNAQQTLLDNQGDAPESELTFPGFEEA